MKKSVARAFEELDISDWKFHRLHFYRISV